MRDWLAGVCRCQVRVRGAPKPGVSRADEATKERRRLRKLLPSAWAQLGIGNDWDTTAPGVGLESRAQLVGVHAWSNVDWHTF